MFRTEITTSTALFYVYIRSCDALWRKERVRSCRTEVSWIPINLVSIGRIFISDDSRMEKMAFHHVILVQGSKKEEKFPMKKLFLRLVDSRQQPARPDRATQCKT